MAKVFSDGDLIDAAFLNKVSASVTDGLGDNVAPATIRVHINAEQAGAASTVQSNLDSHKNTSTIHFTEDSLNLDDKIDDDEKGAPEGVAPLDINSKIPATFLPSTGGYANTYTTQALMVADGATHLNGQVFLVTADPTPANDGEYTATVDAPTVIGDYYFNSGSLPVHGHAAAEVSQTAGGTVQDFIDANPQALDDAFDDKLAGYQVDGPLEPKTTGFDCDSQLGNADYYIDQNVLNWPDGMGNSGHLMTRKISASTSYQRVYDINSGKSWHRNTNNSGGLWEAWDPGAEAKTVEYSNATSGLIAIEVQSAIDELAEASSSAGDLKSDGSVPMSGSYTAAPLGQSLVTRTLMEENFSKRLGGYTTSGKVYRYSLDLNGLVTCGVYNSPFQPAAELNWPTGMNNYGYVDVVAEGSSIVYQTVRSLNASPQEWRRVTVDGGSTWGDWDEIGADRVLKAGDTMTGSLILNADATADMEAVTKQQTLQRDNTGTTTAQQIWSGTKTEYNALTPDSNTLYFISGV